MKVNRHASNLSFYTCQDALRSMKRTEQIHDTLPCRAAAAGQQGNICLVLHQRFELQKKPPGRWKNCEGKLLTSTSPTDPNVAAAEVNNRYEPRHIPVKLDF